ncbi:MAG: PQQ-binding-like beta-propeller repeat protein, partial [Pseudomonadota bacterium]
MSNYQHTLVLLTCFVLAQSLHANDDALSTQAMMAPPTQSWITNGGNFFNQRFSPLDEIDRTNVAKLKGVWRAQLNGSGVGPPFSGEAQPIVHDGVMYLITGADDVFALDIATGAIKWVYESGLDPKISTICCGWTSRGVGIAEGKIFVGRLDSKLVALDIDSGAEIWSAQTASWRDGYTITGAPLYFDGMVITGFAGGEYGVRGLIKAFDADTGDALWTFHTVPGPGEIGHDTWPQGSDAYLRGGATVWHTPAVDPELGLIYFATGNPAPDFNGAVRGGDNLFSVSVVALDAKTGQYQWHFQEVHHDIWDYDAANPVVLFDIEHEGQSRKALAHAGKTGWVYILDRVDGTPLYGIDEKAVPQEPRQLTAATQPYPRGEAFAPQALEMPIYGYKTVNDGKIFTPYWDEPLPIRPSSFGTAVWAPSSYDPSDHSLFICGLDLIGLFVGGTIDGTEPQSQYLGGQFIFDNIRTGIFA